MKNPTKTKLNSLRKGAAEFLKSPKTLEDKEKLRCTAHQYLTNGPTDAINKRSVNMINKRLSPELGLAVSITSGQPDEDDAHRGDHIGATVTIGDHSFEINSYNFIQ
ncbi:hypothetical protein F6R97_04230 [Pseudomonas sp. JV414]|jgi:hypothetical protein|uniref:hypothetical protein n=1 Tax=Pseudomonas sp. JV414 TaxID=1733110 RepID=UPI0028E14036|nr:hypothetical protein [Pseudomonas sp. JV414]MDT9673862.1 hypothetical protein [Pseudomonas sp. JV414]